MSRRKISTSFTLTKHLPATSATTSPGSTPSEACRAPRLYAVWAEKLELLEVARRRRFFGPTTAFFWIDIGIFRDRGPPTHWASDRSLARRRPVAAIAASGRVAMTSVRPFTEEELQRTSDVDARFLDAMSYHVCACAFGGSLAALRMARTVYYALTQTFIDRDIFAGKDQSIWNMMHVRDRNLLELVSPTGCPGDRWFAMVPYLAGAWRPGL